MVDFQKNLCIVITENENKHSVIELAKLVEFKDEQLEPIAKMIWDIKTAKTSGKKKLIIV